MRRVGRRLTGAIKAATGERIVAFGRAGKPPENPFLRPVWAPLFPVRRDFGKPPVFRNGFLSRMAYACDQGNF